METPGKFVCHGKWNVLCLVSSTFYTAYSYGKTTKMSGKCRRTISKKNSSLPWVSRWQIMWLLYLFWKFVTLFILCFAFWWVIVFHWLCIPLCSVAFSEGHGAQLVNKQSGFTKNKRDFVRRWPILSTHVTLYRITHWTISQLFLKNGKCIYRF